MAVFTGGVWNLSIVPLTIPALCRVGTSVYWWDKKIVLCSTNPPPPPKPLSPLSTISSRPPPRPLVRHHYPLHGVCLIRRRLTPLIRSLRPLSRSSHQCQCHYAVASRHSSASHRHRITTSKMPPPSPLTHDAPLVRHQSHHHLLFTTGGPPLASAFITSRTLLSPSLIRRRRLSRPWLLSSADFALSRC